MPTTSSRIALAAVAAATLAVTTLAAAPVASADGGRHGSPGQHHTKTSITYSSGALTDLATATAGPFDDADASAIMIAKKRATFGLLVTGIDASAVGETFGSHLHTGPCVEDDGAAAGPHYNTDVIAGITPPETSPRTEVWLDFTVHEGGWAVAWSTVPFVPTAGKRSIMIHAESTQDDGTAGARIACRPFVIKG